MRSDAYTAFLFPGQGSQFVGMGKSLYEQHATVKRLFDEASAALGRDFAALCFEGPDATLVQTDNVQPAITIVSLAVHEVLREAGVTATAAAGHSLGEYAALCAAGSISFADAITLVAYRGAVMKEAADKHPGGMTAVIGLDFDALNAICADVRDIGSVEVANHNSPTQVILTGELAALQRAAELAKARGAKLTVPLKVSGAWHSRFMQDASERMREKLKGVTLSPPRFPVIANVTAAPYPADADAIRELLVRQIVSPVLWSRSVARLVQDGSRTFVEVGPGKVLAGLMRDISRESKTMGVQDADTLAKFLQVRSASASQ
jgi:[acyl-carrier-protein] S-malonyltransferase